jgi:hypothetical protein
LALQEEGEMGGRYGGLSGVNKEEKGRREGSNGGAVTPLR